MDFKNIYTQVDMFKKLECHSDDIQVVINLNGVLFEIDSLGNGWSGFPISPITIYGKIESGRLDRRGGLKVFPLLKTVFHLFCLILLILGKMVFRFRTDLKSAEQAEKIRFQKQGDEEHIV